MNFLFLIAVLLAVDPLTSTSDKLEDSLKQLKEAESKQDVMLVKKLAPETCALARAIAAEPAPEEADAKDMWTKHVAYARDVEVYTEYALYNAGVHGSPAVTVDLLGTLEKQNPKSKYLAGVYGRYFVALTQSGSAAKIPAVAERAVAYFPNDEDLLLVLANSAMTRKQTDRALNYSERLITALSKHAQPEGMSAADWQRKRASALCRAHWIAGIMHADKTQYYEADKDLRAALPSIGDDPSMKESTLFYLGVANYQLGSALRSKAQILEAAKFSEQSAALKGPLSYQAWRNATVMKTEASKVR